MVWTAFFTTSILVSMLAPALAGSRTVCEPGRYLVTSAIPPPGGEPVEALVIDAAQAAILDGCGATSATVRAGRKSTRVRAKWQPCGDHPKLRLIARIDASTCTTLDGRLRGKCYEPVEFTAVRSTCGDGVVDGGGGEACDASAPRGDVACPGQCGDAAATSPCRCPSSVAAPRDLVATIVGGQVMLGWTPPDPASGNTSVRLLRRLNEPPIDANDSHAALVFDGTASEASHALTALLPTTATTPRTYHYAVFGCTPGGSCEPNGSRATLAPTLVQVLVAGGYVVHWRHASADVCADNLALGLAATTMVPDWWKSCEANCAIATARQLNDDGRNEATVIGNELRTRGVPFGRVVTSEYCRNFQTADLMALGPAPEHDPAITYFVYDEAARCASSYALLATVPSGGTNTALIGHAGFSPSCPVLGELAWGEAAVFKPDGAGGAELVTRVHWNQWSAMTP